MRAAEAEFARTLPQQINNGEETDYPYVANYSKGLPHDGVGEVDRDAYRLMLRALSTGRPDDFERIPLGGTRPLVNPQAGLGFELEGPDPQALTIPPAPRIDGPENSAEMIEAYWTALCRDVPFSRFDTDPLAVEAAAELSGLPHYRAPRQDGEVTAQTLFRGDTRGAERGPYISQFLLRDIPYGTLSISQRQDTVRPGLDYLTTFDDWLAVQNGAMSAPPSETSSTGGTCRRHETWRTTSTSTRCTRRTSTRA